jgi:hypothetical protein
MDTTVVPATHPNTAVEGVFTILVNDVVWIDTPVASAFQTLASTAFIADIIAGGACVAARGCLFDTLVGTAFQTLISTAFIADIIAEVACVVARGRLFDTLVAGTANQTLASTAFFAEIIAGGACVAARGRLFDTLVAGTAKQTLASTAFIGDIIAEFACVVARGPGRLTHQTITFQGAAAVIGIFAGSAIPLTTLIIVTIHGVAAVVVGIAGFQLWQTRVRGVIPTDTTDTVTTHNTAALRVSDAGCGYRLAAPMCTVTIHGAAAFHTINAGCEQSLTRGCQARCCFENTVCTCTTNTSMRRCCCCCFHIAPHCIKGGDGRTCSDQNENQVESNSCLHIVVVVVVSVVFSSSAFFMSKIGKQQRHNHSHCAHNSTCK